MCPPPVGRRTGSWSWMGDALGPGAHFFPQRGVCVRLRSPRPGPRPRTRPSGTRRQRRSRSGISTRSCPPPGAGGHRDPATLPPVFCKSVKPPIRRFLYPSWPAQSLFPPKPFSHPHHYTTGPCGKKTHSRRHNPFAADFKCRSMGVPWSQPKNARARCSLESGPPPPGRADGPGGGGPRGGGRGSGAGTGSPYHPRPHPHRKRPNAGGQGPSALPCVSSECGRSKSLRTKAIFSCRSIGYANREFSPVSRLQEEYTVHPVEISSC